MNYAIKLLEERIAHHQKEINLAHDYKVHSSKIAALQSAIDILQGEVIQGFCDWEDNTLRVGGININAKLYSFYLDQEIVITISRKSENKNTASSTDKELEAYCENLQRENEYLRDIIGEVGISISKIGEEK
jgi:hypothetical protein